MNPTTSHIILYDGHCVMCRYFIRRYIQRHCPPEISCIPIHEADLSEYGDLDKLTERSRREILLYDERDKNIVGGVSALAEILSFSKHLAWLGTLIGNPLLKPVAELGYKMIAWHRYTWFLPPSLRCSGCALQVPFVWEASFIAFFGVLFVMSCSATIEIFFNSLNFVADSLFFTIGTTWEELSMQTTALITLSWLSTNLIAMLIYHKPAGLNRIDILKHSLLVWSLASAIGACMSQIIHWLTYSAMLIPKMLELVLMTMLILTVHFGGACAVFLRWEGLGFHPGVSKEFKPMSIGLAAISTLGAIGFAAVTITIKSVWEALGGYFGVFSILSVGFLCAITLLAAQRNVQYGHLPKQSPRHWLSVPLIFIDTIFRLMCPFLVLALQPLKGY